ncbi:MAG: BrnT family toxin [Spirochaetes bacterium]|nr:BrnT family toxin [Spirochaetota bacterium]
MGPLDQFFESLEGFQWDEGNAAKSWMRHEVSQAECEQLFLNRPLVVTNDEGHSKVEQRFAALGHADSGRQLTFVFTIRGTLLRVISARPMSRRERGVYAKRT